MIPDLALPLRAVLAHSVVARRQRTGLGSVEDADVTDRGRYSGELSYLTPLHGPNSGDSPFGLSFADGTASRTELSLGVGALSGSPAYRREERDDFGDLALGAKTQILGGDLPVALAYGATILTADRTRNDDLVDQSLYAIAFQTRGRLESIENLGTTLPGSTLHRATPVYGGSLVYDAGAGNALSLQANHNQPQNALLRKQLQVGAGVTHAISRAFSLQAQLGQSGRGRRNTGLFLGGNFMFGSAR